MVGVVKLSSAADREVLRSANCSMSRISDAA